MVDYYKPLRREDIQEGVRSYRTFSGYNPIKLTPAEQQSSLIRYLKDESHRPILELREAIAQRNNALWNEDIKSREEKPYEYNRSREPRRVSPDPTLVILQMVKAERERISLLLDEAECKRKEDLKLAKEEEKLLKARAKLETKARIISEDKIELNQSDRARRKELHNLLSTAQGREHFLANAASYSERDRLTAKEIFMELLTI
ncbi:MULTISPECIES: hypothetical protein [unclassified Enterobacter cloacae complex]|uniref:hypothetical protein n=1 Tax=Enterobacter cloacae complex TaxID=354276 RepID=UPI0018729337|nr:MULTISPECIES: hypothetical protein [unclassified Enterobacter cloacae complex]MBE4887536.1 hypothetical protein [Enterobacter cloacae complex sp. P37RS]MBE7432132.1 hypothetical protein [Enterobacter cloacae complex sp. P36RS]MCE1476567.1 hypothetical protein [Enterobacter hormaechei]